MLGVYLTLRAKSSQPDENRTGGVYGLDVARPTVGNIIINSETEFFYLM